MLESNLSLEKRRWKNRARLSSNVSKQHMKKHFKIIIFVTLGLVPIFMLGLMTIVQADIIGQ
jgi:hypothetical protein